MPTHVDIDNDYDTENGGKDDDRIDYRDNNVESYALIWNQQRMS